jgi:hypothetical protein
VTVEFETGVLFGWFEHQKRGVLLTTGKLKLNHHYFIGTVDGIKYNNNKQEAL